MMTLSTNVALVVCLLVTVFLSGMWKHAKYKIETNLMYHVSMMAKGYFESPWIAVRKVSFLATIFSVGVTSLSLLLNIIRVAKHL